MSLKRDWRVAQIPWERVESWRRGSCVKRRTREGLGPEAQAFEVLSSPASEFGYHCTCPRTLGLCVLSHCRDPAHTQRQLWQWLLPIPWDPNHTLLSQKHCPRCPVPGHPTYSEIPGGRGESRGSVWGSVKSAPHERNREQVQGRGGWKNGGRPEETGSSSKDNHDFSQLQKRPSRRENIWTHMWLINEGIPTLWQSFQTVNKKNLS